MSNDPSNLPERDPSKTVEEQGLFRKFDVRRADGSDAPGGKHDGCEYFVLDIDHDPHAAPALIAYANACKNTHPILSADLMARHRVNHAVIANPRTLGSCQTDEIKRIQHDPAVASTGMSYVVPCLKFPQNSASSPACPSDCPCLTSQDRDRHFTREAE